MLLIIRSGMPQVSQGKYSPGHIYRTMLNKFSMKVRGMVAKKGRGENVLGMKNDRDRSFVICHL